ncbi:sporulation histidine kinase inhibitor Sda [Sporolactobacillus vineae]|nr:sporulation histidine kinase inhibitor Sda [Sporolactobacillus vineae]
MENLSDSLLIESYEKALKYHLSTAFIGLIRQEMKRRRIKIPEHQLN